MIGSTPSIDPGQRSRVLVLRFHSLGDCVLATGVTRALAQTAQVTVATEERYLPVFTSLPWIDRLLAREDLEPGRGRSPGGRAMTGGGRPEAEALVALSSGAGPIARFDRVIDLQGTPGARRIGRALGRDSATVGTRSAARRWLVLWGDRFPRPHVPHAVARYAEAAGFVGAGAMETCRPEVRVNEEEEAAARRFAPEAFVSPPGSAVAIVTGASRRTKEYPSERFAEVAGRLRAAGLEVWWIEAPGRGAADDCGLARAGPTGDRRDPAPAAAMPVLRLPLGPLKAVLARARGVVVSDSGPMHLAAALGRPVLGIFGSTVTAFGFAPLGPGARVMEAKDVACRPCGVHGRDYCWLGHWRCLRDVQATRVAEELLALAGHSGCREG